ncbi:retinol dehydrogenase [Colletotrichum abscissum]|uniref:Retinol dehydrogenase n=1 Tax=Colletotrichum abscissum TaxID=1671311 RepID=A0A9P9XIL9_9PEZI|nr:retinol dehydrogenase [Colletotrichum abscissum]KAI3554650.1 retinol dehydrogenase [Colletotrichum abscissum]KAK1514639.1 retinol dehydrogenase [Colletotrichum abscissum]
MAPLVWLITGSTSGFGAEFVKALLAKGDKVIATARDTSKIAHFREAGAAVLKLDLLADQAEFDKVAQDSLSIYGSVDVLVNNAGYSHFGTIEDDSQEDWNKVFQTHLFGPLGTTRAFLPHFRARKSGTFVFIGSTAAWGGIPTLGAYCASKSALRGAVEALNLEVAPLGLKTLLVEPGFFRTELLNANNTVYVDTKNPDYKPIVDPLSAQFKGAHQQQPGDPAKAVSRIIDTVGSRGSAQGRPLPVSLALGPDAVSQLTKKCADTIKLVDDWKEVSSDTLL